MERRKYKRVPKKIVVTCKDLSGKVKVVTNLIYAYTENISIGGMLIKTREKLEPSSALEIKISIPSLSTSIQVVGTVMRCDEDIESDLYDYGIAFIEVDEEDQQILADFIEQYGYVSS